MKNESVLWGSKNGFEEFLSEKPENFEKIIELAKSKGYDNFRIANYNMNIKPDFIGTIEK